MNEHHPFSHMREHGPRGVEPFRALWNYHHGERPDGGDRHHHHGDGPDGKGRHGERGGFFDAGGFGGGPFGGGGFGGGGPFGGMRGRARRGEGRHIILDALKDGPRHGYEIIKALEERSSGRYAPSAGTVYPVLQHLEDLGLVRADQDANRRVYAITDEGKVDLEAHADEVAAFWGRFEAPAVSAASRTEIRFLHDEFHDLGRALWSGLRGVIDAGDSDTIRRVRLTLERCKNEVRDIVAARDGESV